MVSSDYHIRVWSFFAATIVNEKKYRRQYFTLTAKPHQCFLLVVGCVRVGIEILRRVALAAHREIQKASLTKQKLY